MRGSIALLICALVVPVCGCSKEEVVAVGRQAAWGEKFAAANSIRQAETKDAAMADLATQAAQVGQWSILLKALDNIRNTQTHDEAARASATALAKRGRLDYARQIADKIHDTAIKDDTLKQIVKVK